MFFIEISFVLLRHSQTNFCPRNDHVSAAICWRFCVRGGGGPSLFWAFFLLLLLIFRFYPHSSTLLSISHHAHHAMPQSARTPLDVSSKPISDAPTPTEHYSNFPVPRVGGGILYHVLHGRSRLHAASSPFLTSLPPPPFKRLYMGVSEREWRELIVYTGVGCSISPTLVHILPPPLTHFPPPLTHFPPPLTHFPPLTPSEHIWAASSFVQLPHPRTCVPYFSGWGGGQHYVE